MENKENLRNLGKVHKTNNVDIEVREILLNENIRVQNDNRCKKYNRNIIRAATNYNFLEYFLIVRMYMQKKHNISNRMLELLLFLYPKKLFTWYDYKEYPLTFTHRKIDSLIKCGMVEVFRSDTGKNRKIYRLTIKAQTIVKHLYEYLSGEKKLPTNRQNNPLMAKKPKTRRDQMIQDMVEKMASNDNPRFDIE